MGGVFAEGLKREFNCMKGENLTEIPKLWAEVNAQGIARRLFELNNGALKGVLGVCRTTDELRERQAMEYWVAACEDDVQAPDGMAEWRIPAAKWVVFEVRGPMPKAMQDAWKMIYSEWFPSTGYEHAGQFDIELYPEENPYLPDSLSEIWIPVK